MSGFFNKAHCLLLGLVHCLMLVRSALFVQYFFFNLSLQPFIILLSIYSQTTENLLLVHFTQQPTGSDCIHKWMSFSSRGVRKP